jgi:hypothetical protein
MFGFRTKRSLRAEIEKYERMYREVSDKLMDAERADELRQRAVIQVQGILEVIAPTRDLRGNK